MTILFAANTVDDFPAGGGTDSVSNNASEAGYSSREIAVSALKSQADVFGFKMEVTSTDFWLHFRYFTGRGGSSSNNDGIMLDMRDANGGVVAALDVLNGNFRAQIGNSAFGVNQFTMGNETLHVIDLHVTVGANITVDFYDGGALVESLTATNSDSVGGVQNVLFQNYDMNDFYQADNAYYSEIIATDAESTIGWRLADLSNTAAGNYADWVGDYTAVASRRDGQSIASQTAGQRESWQVGGYGGPGTASAVRVVHVLNASKGISGPQNLTPFYRIGATDYDLTPFSPDGMVAKVVEEANNPATALPWTIADLGTFEFGVLSTA